MSDVQAAKFRSEQLEEYVAARRRAEASDSTINRELTIVRRGFSLALRREPPLLSRARFIDKLQEGSPREEFLEDGQYAGLRNELPGHLKCLFVFGYHLGCRQGELLKIRRGQVDVAAGAIRLTQTQTKNKQARTLLIYGEMRAWIENATRRTGAKVAGPSVVVSS